MRSSYVRVHKKHVSLIHHVLRQAHKQNQKLGFHFPVYSFTRNHLCTLIQRDRYYALYVDGIVIGTIAIKQRNSYMEIGSLAVLPSYQKSGWGTALLRFAESKMMKMGKKSAVLFTPANHSSLLSYYEKQGYRIKRIVIMRGKRWVRFEKKLMR